VKCSEFKENVAAFALDALTEDERRACEAHLEEAGPHEGCEDELRRAYETTALIGAALPTQTPDEHVWEAIEQVLGTTGSADPPATEPASSHPTGASPDRPGGATGIAGARRSRLREVSAWGLAIAATIAAIALLNTWRNDQARIAELEGRLAVSHQARLAAGERLASARGKLGGRLRDVEGRWRTCLDDLKSANLTVEEYDRALRLMGAPQTLLIQLAAQGDVPYRASALMNGPEGEAMLLSSALAPQAGKDYQLWLIRGDQKISAGVLKPGADVALARIDPELLRAGAPDALAITIEPTGGMPQPTGPIVLLGKVGA